MKELSIEEKAKAYDEALERAEKALEVLGTDKCEGARQILSLFPELCESENEKIKHEIKVILANTDLSQFALEYTFADMLAWLEKQGTPNQTLIWKHWKDGICGNGEGKPIYLIKYGRIYSLSSCLCFECDYIELSELDKLLSEKQGEQRAAWSEEDEQYLLVCKNALAKYQTTDKWDANIIYNWLKNKLQKL